MSLRAPTIASLSRLFSLSCPALGPGVAGGAGRRRPRLLPLALLGAVAALALGAVLPRPAAAQGAPFIAIGEIWQYQKGTVAPPEDWNTLDFDDVGWLDGPTGIGYADGDDATVLDDMINGYMSIFARKLFTVPNKGAVGRLFLRINYDDGFVAYLNGEEAARSASMAGIGPPVPFDAAAGGHEAGAFEVFEIDAGLLENGDNVLAVEVHNTALGSSDLSFVPELGVDLDVCPSALALDMQPDEGVTLAWTAAIAYSSYRVLRNGVEIDTLDGTLAAYADASAPEGELAYSIIALDGAKECAALTGSIRYFTSASALIAQGASWRFLRGDLPVPTDWFEESYDDGEWEEGPTGIGYGDGDDATILSDMIQRADDAATPEDESQPGYLAVFLRTTFSLSSPGSLLISMVYDDGAAVFINGEEVGRVNLPAGPPTELMAASVAIDPGAPYQLVVPAEKTHAGTNVIAISVHNAALTSSDLSLIPWVVALEGGPVQPRFRRGDATRDQLVNLTDGIAILNFLFRGGATPECLDAADADDSGVTNLSDAIFLLNSLFRGSGPLPEPQECGTDPTPDTLEPCGGQSC